MTLHMYCITTKKANNLIALRKQKIECIYMITYKKDKLNQQIET